MPYQPCLAISMGDPAGIGPEIILKALADPGVRQRIRPVLVGDPDVLRSAASICKVKARLEAVAKAGPFPAGRDVIPVIPAPVRGKTAPGRWTQATGRASLAAVTKAAHLVLEGKADALVTAPICKEAWQAAGAAEHGHTEYLARLTRTKKFAMMFVGGPFRLVLATIHEPLAAVPRLLTRARIRSICLLAARELQLRFGLARPKIAVAGLNPHAGENGLLGKEEQRIIGPVVRSLQAYPDFEISGPYPPDTLFAQALQGRWDLVVCMYHDQGLIPFKMLALHTGVNVTAGLPIIRTSPDHGTAFDLAGTGRANPGSIIAAIRTAAEMVLNQRKAAGKTPKISNTKPGTSEHH